jgi:hypothetical protein
LHFIRLPAVEAQDIWKALGEDWTGNLSSTLAKELLRQVSADSP